MSVEFEFDISPKDEASAIFMGRNHRTLLRAALNAKKKHKITQKQIADMIGVNKSVISRALRGENNLTERTIAEICWALGVEPKLMLTEIDREDKNEPSIATINTSSTAIPSRTKSHSTLVEVNLVKQSELSLEA